MPQARQPQKGYNPPSKYQIQIGRLMLSVIVVTFCVCSAVPEEVTRRTVLRPIKPDVSWPITDTVVSIKPVLKPTFLLLVTYVGWFCMAWFWWWIINEPHDQRLMAHGFVYLSMVATRINKWQCVAWCERQQFEVFFGHFKVAEKKFSNT